MTLLAVTSRVARTALERYNPGLSLSDRHKIDQLVEEHLLPVAGHRAWKLEPYPAGYRITDEEEQWTEVLVSDYREKMERGMRFAYNEQYAGVLARCKLLLAVHILKGTGRSSDASELEKLLGRCATRPAHLPQLCPLPAYKASKKKEGPAQ